MVEDATVKIFVLMDLFANGEMDSGRDAKNSKQDRRRSCFVYTGMERRGRRLIDFSG